MSCRNSLYILEINLLLDIWYANIFSFCRLPFRFVGCFLCCVESFEFNVAPLVFVCVACALGIISMKFFQRPMSWRFSSLFSRSFTVAGLTFRSVIYFELISIYCVKLDLLFFYMWLPSCPTPFVEETVLSPPCMLGTLISDQLYTYRWMLCGCSIPFHRSHITCPTLFSSVLSTF